MPDKSSRRWRTTASRQIRAQQLRREQTIAEQLLWAQLRDRRLDGHKFRRQHPVGRFIVDFCCVEQRLIVEVDGSVHREVAVAANDAERTAALVAEGYCIIRFGNAQVTDNLQDVIAQLRAALSV